MSAAKLDKNLAVGAYFFSSVLRVRLQARAMSVRAVLLRAGLARPEWVQIGANASGPELSSIISSSQPECLALAPRVLLWFDGTPFCTTASLLGTFLLSSTFIGTGLLVGSTDPREHSSDDELASCNCDLEWSSLVPLFSAEFLECLQ